MLTHPRTADGGRKLVEFDEVVLLRPITKNGVIYSEGARGIVVWCHPDGLAFEVEFASQQPAVVTVLGQDLS